MNSADLHALIAKGETQYTEFKRSINKDLSHEVTAFANANGGRILIGVEDNGTICGTDTTNAARAKIENIITNIEPRLKADIEVIDTVLIIRIPDGANKPYLCSDGFYIRDNSLSRKLTREEIREFFQQEGQVTFDDEANYDADFSQDLSREAYTAFLHAAHMDPSRNPEETLLNLSCAAREQDKTYFTNAGVLFFAQNPTKYFPQAEVLCAVYKGIDKTNVLDRKAYHGTIPENIEAAMQYLIAHLNLRYEIEELRRREILDVPEVALREAIVNAVCHRNYFERGAVVTIEIFDNRVVISNPGGLAHGLDESRFGTLSVCRNPVIASLLHRAGYVERMGTGIARIRNAMQDAGLPAPDFQFNAIFSVTLTRDVLEIPKIDAKGVSPLGMKILACILKDGAITIPLLADTIGVSERTVWREIKVLKSIGVLYREGSSKSGVWRVR